MPALAQIQPLRVSTISTSRSARTTAALSLRISSTRRGSLPSPRRPARAPGRRAPRRRGRRTRPSALETAFCDDGHHVDGRQLLARAGRAAAISSPRRSPVATSGRPRTGTISTPGLIREPDPRAALLAPARPPSPGRGQGRAPAPRPSRRGRRACRRRGPGSRAARPRPRDRAGVARSRMTGAAVRAEGRADRVRRREQQRVGSGAVAVGHDRHTIAPHPLERRVELGGVEQRAVSGKQGDALGPERLGPDDPQRRRLRVAACPGVREEPRAAWRRAVRGEARSARRAPRR